MTEDLYVGLIFVLLSRPVVAYTLHLDALISHALNLNLTKLAVIKIANR